MLSKMLGFTLTKAAKLLALMMAFFYLIFINYNLIFINFKFLFIFSMHKIFKLLIIFSMFLTILQVYGNYLPSAFIENIINLMNSGDDINNPSLNNGLNNPNSSVPNSNSNSNSSSSKST